MNNRGEPSDQEAAVLRDRLEKEAAQGGYNINPDKEFTLELARGLLTNESRYGYQACPCRLADGIKEKDLDIICPCIYRDPDLFEFGACFCALYVNDDIKDGKERPSSIPERRPPENERHADRIEGAPSGAPQGAIKSPLRYPIWRCTVCGYLCAREEPPLICPVCKAKKERFERFF